MELFKPEFGLVFWMFFVFVVLFAILAKYAWPYIIRSIDDRADLIDKGVEYAQDAKAQLETEKTEVNNAKAEIESKNNSLKANKQEKQLKVNKLNDEQKKIQNEIDTMEAELKKIYESASNTDGEIYSGELKWPVPSYGKDWITSPFGYRWHPIWGTYLGHKGVDIGGNYGTTIVAAEDGVVVDINTGCSHNYGKNYSGDYIW